MKILITTGLYPPEIGGPATYSKMLEDNLPDRGFNVGVLPFSRVRKYPKLIKHIVYAFLIIKLGRKVNLIYTLDTVSVGFPTMLACKILRKKYMLRVPGDYAWEQGVLRFGVKESLDTFSKKKVGYGFFVWFFKKVQIMVAKNAFKIVTPSNYLKKIVSNWGGDISKVFVVNNIFEYKFSGEESVDFKEKLNLNEGDLILSSVARLVPWKGFDTLIDVILELDDNVKLFIAGDGPDFKKLENKINSKGLSDRVFLLGRLNRVELFTLLNSSDLFVLNTFYEGFSHQLLEVMNIGTPVVSTDVGGNPEVIENFVEGLLVEYNNKEEIKNAILRILGDEKFAKQISQKAREKAGQFTKAKALDKLEDVLNSI